MTELKPCPFCGSYELFYSGDAEYFYNYFIICDQCGCKGPYEKNKELARQAWNDRK